MCRLDLLELAFSTHLASSEENIIRLLRKMLVNVDFFAFRLILEFPLHIENLISHFTRRESDKRRTMSIILTFL